MTLVWRTQSGSLIQTQVGMTDVVNTLSAARSVYGWMGGTEGLRSVLDCIRNPLGRRLHDLKLDKQLRLQPFRGLVLTSHGPLVAHMDDAQGSFGSDIRTQVIGTTLCALAHEFDIVTAANLFRQFLMPYLFGENTPLLDALQIQLLEDSTCQKIINEGASRGLNDLFLETATRLGLPVLGQGWRRKKPGQEDEDDFLGEVKLVAGFLKWFVDDGNTEYRTRSGCVARLAAYLKAVGYNMGSIQTWEGVGIPPSPLGIKCLTLVLGGFSETDPLMEGGEDVQTPNQPPISHYQHSTTGALLLTALGDAPPISPECLQEDFDQVFDYVEKHLTIDYFAEDGQALARYNWKSVDIASTPTAIRLASVYFPALTEFVAPCFNRIANGTYLSLVTERRFRGIIRPEKKELGRLRAITASIVIAIVSRFAPKTFKIVRHATSMDLYDDLWLSEMCKTIDQVKYPSLSQVVSPLAELHVAPEDDSDLRMTTYSASETRNSNKIAWRRGIYSIFPSYLFNMELSPANVQFVCSDQFWANVKTQRDGSIRTTSGPGVQRYDIDIDQPSGIADLSDLERQGDLVPAPSILGPPELSAPDCPLYLSLGSPMHTIESCLCFVAWINGAVAGTVGIRDSFYLLAVSNGEPEVCPGHDRCMQFINIKTSIWAQNYWDKPQSRQHPIFMPVCGDKCWAIFAAGQLVHEDGRIVFKCPTCAVENYRSRLPDSMESPGQGPRGCFIGLL